MTEPRADDHGPVGSAVLDIGDGVGALVVHTGAALRGREVEVSPAGRDHDRQHAEVLARQAGERTVHAVIISSLPVGHYTLWQPDGDPWGAVEISDGEVTEVDWRAPPASSGEGTAFRSPG